MTPNKQSIELMTWFQVPLFTSPRLLEAFVTISLHGQCVEPLSTWHLSFSIAKVMARPWIGNSAKKKSVLNGMSLYVWICYVNTNNTICLNMFEDCNSWSTVKSCQVFARRFGLRNVDGLATILHSGHSAWGLVTSSLFCSFLCIKQTFKM